MKVTSKKDLLEAKISWKKVKNPEAKKPSGVKEIMIGKLGKIPVATINEHPDNTYTGIWNLPDAEDCNIRIVGTKIATIKRKMKELLNDFLEKAGLEKTWDATHADLKGSALPKGK